VSLTGATFSYRTLKSREDALLFGEGIFTIGEFDYRLVQGQGDSRVCVGEYRGSFLPDGNTYVYRGSGFINVEFEGAQFSPQISVQAAFSELNQLGGSAVRVTEKDLFFSIGTVGVDPIRILSKTVDAGKESKYEFPLPGPIELRRTGKTSFGLRYPHFTRLRMLPKGPSELTALLRSSFTLEDAATNRCDRNGSLNAAPFVTILRAFVGRFGSLLTF
jgi:hypothetical protein